MDEQRQTTTQELAGLSIAPDYEPPYRLVLKLGARRPMRCNLELDHPDFDSGRLDGVFTLNCWLALLQRLSTGTDPVVLLGYDFADQYSAWLRVGPIRSGLVEVQPGLSGFTESTLEPGDLLDPRRRIHDFEADQGPGLVRPLVDIVAQVTAARDALAQRRAAKDPTDK